MNHEPSRMVSRCEYSATPAGNTNSFTLFLWVFLLFLGGNLHSPLSGTSAQPFSGITGTPAFEFWAHLVFHGL